MIDLILALVLVEGLLLSIYHFRTGRGPAPSRLLYNLTSGAALLLAVRAVQTDAEWIWLAGALLLALVTHLFDLRKRWNT